MIGLDRAYLPRNCLTADPEYAALPWGQKVNWPWLLGVARVMHLPVPTCKVGWYKNHYSNLLCEVEAVVHGEVVRLHRQTGTKTRQSQPLAVEVELQYVLGTFHLVLKVAPGLSSELQVCLCLLQDLVKKDVKSWRFYL